LSGPVRHGQGPSDVEEALRAGVVALQDGAQACADGAPPDDGVWNDFLLAADRFVRGHPTCLAFARRHALVFDFEDLVGEFLVHLGARRERVLALDATRGVAAWFARVFRHRVRDLAERARRRRHLSLYDGDGRLREDVESRPEGPGVDVLEAELDEQRGLLLAGLSEREGEALWRRCVDEESYDAIAARLATSRNGAYILVSRAKRALSRRSDLRACLD